MLNSLQARHKKFLHLSFIVSIVMLFIVVNAAHGKKKTVTVFSRGIMDQIPDSGDLRKVTPLTDIKLNVLRGEYEPFAFSLYCNNICKDVDIKISRLKNDREKNHLILPDQIEIHRLKKGNASYRIKDWILDPMSTKDIDRWKMEHYWMTIHIPEDTDSGLYKGHLVITVEGENVLEVPVEIEVLHPVLEDLPDVQFALLYTVSPFGQYFKKKKYFNLETRVIDFYKELRAHGMTAISPKNSDWPYRPEHIEGLKAEVRLALRAGIKGPVLWYMSSLINGAKGGKLYSHYDGKCDNWNEKRDLANLKDIVITTKEAERKESWPEVIFIPVDEPGTMTENRKLLNLRMNILEKTLRVIHEMGARGATTLSEPVDERHNKLPFVKTLDELRKKWGKSRPYADIRIYNYGFPQGKTNLFYEMSDSEQRGHEVWFYNNKAIIGNDRYVARVYYGLWGWKVKPAGLTSWTYPGARTIQWEIVREGIDDFKYLRLIERLYREKPVHDVNRKYAEAFLEEISESVKLDDNGFIKDWNKWKNYDFAEFRRRSIKIIKRLSM